MIEILKLIPGGQALAELEDGKKAFFWNALPGEIVEEYRIVKKKAHYVEAVATKLSSLSSCRVEPKDACFLATSPWQIVNDEYELKMKAELLVEQFRQAGIIIDAPEVVTDGKTNFYRNKMEYALYWDFDTKKIKLAFHERGSHKKIPIDKSSLERPEIFKKAASIISELNEKHEEARKYQSLLLRCDQNGKVSGGLFENGKPHPIFENLADEILGHKYFYSPNGFFQINLPVYEMALSEIKKYIDGGKVLDLYAGVGTIGLSVARGLDLTLVENNKDAYRELEKNAEGANCKPVLAKSEDCLEYIVNDETVILDPPRAGCDKKLIDKILEARPKTLIYLSCNPATQARDVAMLKDKYIMERIISFNFFPKTPHLENLVVLKNITR